MVVTGLVLGLLLVATYTDVRWRKIYNWTTYPGILLALLLSLVFSLLVQDALPNSMLNESASATTGEVWGVIPLSDCVLGILASGGAMLVCYIFFPGGVGGGDIKLLAMLGAFLGVMDGLEVMLWTFVLAACMALIVLVWRYGLPRLMVRSFRFALYKFRLGGAFQLSEQEREPLQTDLFLSPSALAAFVIVRFQLTGWL